MIANTAENQRVAGRSIEQRDKKPAISPSSLMTMLTKAILFYFLACLSKEIFLPLIVIIMVDPRVSIKDRIRSTIAYLMAASAFWLMRWMIVGQFIGGYSDGLPISTDDGFIRIFSGLTEYFALSFDGIAVGVISFAVIGITAYVSQQKFGLRSTLLMGCGISGMLFVPLLPVSLQIGPHAPIEIRLLTMVWSFLAFCTAIALDFVRQRGGMHAARILCILILAALTWNTVHYLRYSNLAAVERQFDNFTSFVVEKLPCNLIDNDGWSSWTHDLYGAIWPGVSHPVVAPEEILRATAALGSTICRSEKNGIVVTGTIDRIKPCQIDTKLSVRLAYDGTYIHFSFGPDQYGFYYLEVPGQYFLRLPARYVGTMPNISRFENFRILRIAKEGGVACSPLLHFLPASEPTLVWQ